MLKRVFQRYFQNNWLFILLFLGILSWSLPLIKSGLCWNTKCFGGLGFWGPNGHDGIWHIALAKSLARGSWQMPTFAGKELTNYHVGFDLLLVLINKLTKIPIRYLYFQIIPPTLALLVGVLTYKFVFLWRKSNTQALMALFFVYFGGSWGWVLGKGESTFWAQQAVSSLINPPFALSLVLILLGLLFLLRKKSILAILVFGSLIQVKAYAGVLCLGGLLIAGVWKFLKERDLRVLKVFLGALVFSLLLFLPLNKASGSLFIFKPFWFLETMMQLTDRLGWLKLGEAMVNYRLGGIWIKAVLAYGLGFLIFWYGNMGTRLLAEIFMAKRLVDHKKLSVVEVFIFSIILAGLIMPMFFLQKGTPWNTIQFFYYSLFFSGILAGVWLGEFWEGAKSSTSRYGLLLATVMLTVPTTINTLKHHYLPERPPARISLEELGALRFLARQPEGIVLTYPFDREAAKEAEKNPPRPLYLYESTAYVSAFSNKPVFLEDEVNLDITGYDWRSRRKEVEDWLKTQNHEMAYQFLRRNKISYVYWLKGQRAVLGETQLGLTKIFENKEVNIYKVIE
jgi:hypothetical protein